MKTLLISALLFSVSPAWSKLVNINTTTSQINWTGEKKIPGAGDHKGTVKLKKGTVNLDKEMKITGGTLVIDMTTIEDTDLSGKYKKKLEDHLNSEDFFHVKKHPEATFKITKVESTRSNLYKVTGNLTLRGKTNSETFEISVDKKKVPKKGSIMIASGEITFDRSKYGVSYNSEASVAKKLISIPKDKVIKDSIKLSLQLQTSQI